MVIVRVLKREDSEWLMGKVDWELPIGRLQVKALADKAGAIPHQEVPVDPVGYGAANR